MQNIGEHRQAARRHKHKLRSMMMNWNLPVVIASHLNKTGVLQKLWSLITELNIQLGLESETLKEDSGEGGAVTGLSSEVSQKMSNNIFELLNDVEYYCFSSTLQSLLENFSYTLSRNTQRRKFWKMYR